MADTGFSERKRRRLAERQAAERKAARRMRMRRYPGLTTGDLARRFGVTPDAVRYWEREGFIPPAVRRGSVRYWDEGVIETIKARLRAEPEVWEGCEIE